MNVSIRVNCEILSSKDVGKDYVINLINLPMELLVKMFYLSSRDRMMVRNVSQRFRKVAKIPLLWEEFTLYYHNMDMMKNLLKAIGEHVRKVYMDTNDTHHKNLCPYWVCEICNAMPHLQHLELMLNLEGEHGPGNNLTCYCEDDTINAFFTHLEDIVPLLEIIPASIKKLDLVLSVADDLDHVVIVIQAFANQCYALPSIINIFGEFNITATDKYGYKRGQMIRSCLRSQNFIKPHGLNLPANATSNLFEFWSKSAFYLSSFEIHLHDRVPIPMNLFPPVPVRSYKFGAAETPNLIQLPGYGIVGLKDNVFHFSEYIDDQGMVSHAVTPARDHDDCFGSLIEERHITCIPHLHTVSYVDISYENV